LQCDYWCILLKADSSPNLRRSNEKRLRPFVKDT
jgi:hypothetical protein